MPYAFLDIAATPSVLAAQAANGAAGLHSAADRPFDRLGAAEAQFIAERDSFYMATVSEDGWPYVQHRGGPPGFLKVLDETTLAFADYRGNRQYISVGNLAAGDKAALIVVDYARRARLKILAQAEALALDQDPELTRRVLDPDYRARPERILRLRLAAFDWNCPQHITQRFTKVEIAAATAPLTERLEALEAENAALRARLGESGPAQ